MHRLFRFILFAIGAGSAIAIGAADGDPDATFGAGGLACCRRPKSPGG